MTAKQWLSLWLIGVLLVVCGCASLFPTKQERTESQWKSFVEVDDAFAQIIPNETKAAELRVMGFDPNISPNVKLLNYVDIIRRFMPNQAITKEDLHPAVRACIEAKDQSRAYEVDLMDLKSKRHGNLFLDITGFKRETRETGWQFKGLILIQNDLVVYTLVSAEPATLRETKEVKPLGPLQDLSGLLGRGYYAIPR